MQFTILVTLFAAVMGAQAAPYNPRFDARSVETRSGCDSTGPFGEGHFEWFVTGSCTPGQQFACQAMDASGCEPGQTGKIGSLEVDVSQDLFDLRILLLSQNVQDPDDTQQFAKQSHTNNLVFTCPAGGQVRCQANFEDNSDGPGYSLRSLQIHLELVYIHFDVPIDVPRRTLQATAIKAIAQPRGCIYCALGIGYYHPRLGDVSFAGLLVAIRLVVS
ncbi:hypothetical protein GLOTRDRAFT_92696 [Gloeophyllum trabeum ATCC 11539]|uniref:Uncharacterized protein n=1 Tax=Gloeophyllum trabeum (strain ATCC 11539 / FP-39264 / Madison 617) TaxID=670483 RepID=S7Q9Y1_GLOTA|nr:uncharacterized protein GLOTRDRAFT_92696 [Gloeophyllum trabeum ATCC 11539]EPQ56153.1 hypothetical protein GLOTRDRAFT_92696 [Gloeophyllum trabeum ATCC 11539]